LEQKKSLDKEGASTKEKSVKVYGINHAQSQKFQIVQFHFQEKQYLKEYHIKKEIKNIKKIKNMKNKIKILKIKYNVQKKKLSK